jgi:hypothetical protein
MGETVALRDQWEVQEGQERPSKEPVALGRVDGTDDKTQ